MATCETKKIDSNVVGLNYAIEECLGQLPSTPKWQALEPNSFSDFGGELNTTNRTPLSISRQNQKGVVTDLSVKGGFNIDFTQNNLNDLLEGVFFADTRKKTNYQFTGGSGDIKFASTDNIYSLTATTADFTTLGLVEGEWIFVGGDNPTERFDTAGTFYARVSKIEAKKLTFDNGTFRAGLSADAGASKTIKIFMGAVLKNERTADLIKRKSYCFERTLGKDLSTNQKQAEYISGAVLGEFSLEAKQGEMLKADLSFIATNNEYRTGALLSDGKLTASLGESGINTTSDIRSIRLSLVDDTKSTSTPLFAYVTETSIEVNNNLSENKALGTFGAIDVSAGNFEVSGKTTAYFTTVQAVEAVRKNADVGLYALFATKGKGLIFDIPLVGLGGGTLNVEKDNPITLELEAMGAENKFGYTMMYVNFPLLPKVAM
jgi:hypothetical protein